jgi:hypothetical protein
MVNPLWIEESINSHTVLPYNDFLVKKTYTDLVLSNNRKRKYNDLYSDHSLPKKTRKTETSKKLTTTQLENKENIRRTTNGVIVRVVLTDRTYLAIT